MKRRKLIGFTLMVLPLTVLIAWGSYFNPELMAEVVLGTVIFVTVLFLWVGLPILGYILLTSRGRVEND